MKGITAPDGAGGEATHARHPTSGDHTHEVGIGGTLAVESQAEPAFTLRVRIPRSVVILAVTVLVGLTLRVLAAWETNGRFPDTPERLLGDEQAFDWMARDLLAGSFFPWPGKTPVYPMFLAVCYWLFGYSFATILYVQAIIGTLVIPLTFFLARRLANSSAALIASGIVALHPVLIREGINLLTELPYTPLLVTVAVALVWANAQPSIWRYIVVGLALAVLNLTRPAALYAIFGLPLMLPAALGLKRRVGFSLVSAAAMVLVIAPWTLHNYRQFHAFIPLSVASAVLWQGSPEYYHLMENHWTFTEMWSTFLDPNENGGHDPFSVDGSKYFTNRAIASIKSEPLTYIRYSAQKAVYFWIGQPMADWEWPFDVNAMHHYYPPWWQFLSIYVGRAFALIGLVAMFALWRKWVQFGVLVGAIAYMWAFHAATYAEVRYSEPLYPFLAIFIGVCIVNLRHHARGGSPECSVTPELPSTRPASTGVPAAV